MVVRDCDPELLRAVVADIAAPPAAPELLARFSDAWPDDIDTRHPRLLMPGHGAEEPPLAFTVPLQATYYCGMVQRNVWENVTLTLDAYDGGGSLDFSMPVQRGWQLEDHGPTVWPGQTEWYAPSHEQFFLSLAMTLSPARITLVCGNDTVLEVLSTWDEAFMGASSTDAAAALQWSAERDRDCMIQYDGAPCAYLIQRFYAHDFDAARLARAATQPFGENDSDDEEDANACETYDYYHTYYDVEGLPAAGEDERALGLEWRVRSRYDTWQRLCWLRPYNYESGNVHDDWLPVRAACRALLRGAVLHEAADALPAWRYDATLATEAHNVTLLQLRALGLRAGRAAPLEYFRCIGAAQPLLDVAARRVLLHHAARVIQRAWHHATNCPDFAMARARVAALMEAVEDVA